MSAEEDFLALAVSTMPTKRLKERLRRLQVANIASAPSTSTAVHALHLTPDHAYELAESSQPVLKPIVVSGDHSHKWRPHVQPLRQLWEYFPSVESTLDILKNGKHSHESLGAVRPWFEGGIPTKKQIIIPRARCPLPTNAIPSFLNGPGASLLHQVLDTKRSTRRQHGTSHQVLQGFGDSTNWFTASSGGLPWRPRLDNYGLGTWITCHQGDLGFAWLSDPSTQQVQSWMQDPHSVHADQNWRFLVLFQGDTVYIESGVPYFLFSPLMSDKTFATGGHIIRKSQVSRWLALLIREIECRETPGASIDPFYHSYSVESMKEVMKALLEGVACLIEAAARDGRTSTFGTSPSHVSTLHEDVLNMLEQTRSGTEYPLEVETGEEHRGNMPDNRSTLLNVGMIVQSIQQFDPAPATSLEAGLNSLKHLSDASSAEVKAEAKGAAPAVYIKSPDSAVIAAPETSRKIPTKSVRRREVSTTPPARHNSRAPRSSRATNPRYDDQTTLKELREEEKRAEKEKKLHAASAKKSPSLTLFTPSVETTPTRAPKHQQTIPSFFSPGNSKAGNAAIPETSPSAQDTKYALHKSKGKEKHRDLTQTDYAALAAGCRVDRVQDLIDDGESDDGNAFLKVRKRKLLAGSASPRKKQAVSHPKERSVTKPIQKRKSCADSKQNAVIE